MTGLPRNYTIREHSYLWRADGDGATQGPGSIVNYPNLSSGTAAATLSQVPVAEVPTIPNGLGTLPGTGSFIKCVASGGASGGNIDISLNIAAASIANLGNFGLFFYDPTEGTTDIGGITFYVVNNAGFAKFFIFSASATSPGASGRVKGWNLFNWQRGDQTTTGGAYTYDETSARLMLRVSMQANKSATFYFGDVLHGWYTKPQIMIWAADNGGGAYDVMLPYMSARNIPGSYMPTSRYFANPNINQITVSEFNEFMAAGWTMVPHQTIGTGFAALTTEALLRAEIDEVLATHASYGWTYKDYYYPPGGAWNAFSDSVLASYGIGHGNNGNAANVNKSRPLYGGDIAPYRIWNYTADGKTFSSDIRPLIDHALKYGGYCGINWHDGDGADESHFKSSVDLLYRLREANMLDCPNYETFFDRFDHARRRR